MRYETYNFIKKGVCCFSFLLSCRYICKLDVTLRRKGNARFSFTFNALCKFFFFLKVLALTTAKESKPINTLTKQIDVFNNTIKVINFDYFCPNFFFTFTVSTFTLFFPPFFSFLHCTNTEMYTYINDLSVHYKLKNVLWIKSGTNDVIRM